MRKYCKDDFKRIRVLERILRNEKADEVKRLLAIIGLVQFASRSDIRA
jgi:hypothetical protein